MPEKTRTLGPLLKSRFLRAFAGSLGVAVGSRLALLAMSVLVGRQLAPEGYGTFNFALGVGLLTGQLVTLGLAMLQTRLIPGHLETEAWGSLRGLMRRSNQLIAIVSLVGALVLVLVSRLPHMQSGLASGLLLSALMTPIFGFRTLRRQQLIAVGRPQEALFIDEALPPLAVCAVALITTYHTPVGVLLTMAAASMVGIALGGWRLFVRIPAQVRTAKPLFTTRSWLAMSLPMQGGALARLMLNRIDVIMLAPLAGAEVTGYYSAAFRITYLLTFLPVILNTILSPRFSAAYASGQTARIRRLYFGGLAFAVAVVLPFMLVLVFGAEFIMTRLFGPAFAPAAPLLQLLAISQAIFAFSVISSTMMVMTGRHNNYAVINIGALLSNLALNATLIPAFGGIGAACAAIVSSIILMGGQSIMSNRILRSHGAKDLDV